jgi:elongation factor G
MKEYAADKIRNIALVGHSGAGKTALAEAMLYNSGAITRMGTTQDGNTVSDFDDEEIRRGISIHNGVIPVEHEGSKFNVIDTPGYADFVGDVISALQVTDMALVVVDSVAGVEVGTEIAWQQLDKLNQPRVVIINKMDRDTSRWERVLADLRESFDARFLPVQLPIGNGEDFKGVYRLVSEKASLGEKGVEGEVPESVLKHVEEMREAIVEAAAESDDELIMKYLEGEELTKDEIRHGLEVGAMRGKYVPVFFTSATHALGVQALMHSLQIQAPSVAEAAPRIGTVQASGEEIALEPDPSGPLVARIFKTQADPYVGKLQYLRVFSGTLEADSRVWNVEREVEERIGPVYNVRGKEQIATGRLVAGDIGAVAKLHDTHTFDCLVDKDHAITMPKVEQAQAVYSVALTPVTQSDAPKLGQALQRLLDEDPTYQSEFVSSTRQLVLHGMGDAHIDVAVHALKEKFGVDVNTSIPRVPYQETVTRSATAQYRHKKQTGGAGQFAEVHLRVEPVPRGQGFSYDSEVRGGSISSTFIPSIEKGIRQVLIEGVIAHCEVVDTKAIVYDGKEHPVDSKDIAFQIAGREAFKEAMRNAGPALLEPIHDITVVVPSAQMGDVLGDLNGRRGMVQGTEQIGQRVVVKAQVPLAEIQRYATDLRSMTQGRGYYTAEFSHYAPVPHNVQQEVIAAVEQAEDEE